MVGVLGGTFDPIHYGHLRPAREVMQALGLARLLLVPAFDPPHRRAPAAPAEHRLAMARLALTEFPEFEVDDREYRLGGKSYTVRTLESLRAELGATSLCLLLGTDAFDGIASWHEWQRLPELAHLVVMQRPGWTASAPAAWAEARQADSVAALQGKPAGRIYYQGVTPQEISATALRAALARGADVSGALPAAVLAYIEQKGLYGRINE
jgi:nicotinate-nucleotide adenylyltransferase